MTDAPEVVISITVVTAIPEQVHRTIEAFSRAATGLALEGLYVNITATTVDDSDEDET